MSGEINFFRKRFFGGFNREDVVKYISELAHERNEYKSAKDIAENEAKTMADEIEPLRAESAQARKKETELKESIEVAENEVSELREAKEKAEREVRLAEREVTSLKQELDEAKKQLDEMRDAKNKITYDMQTLKADYDNLKDKLEITKREADEGRVFKNEALKSRDKVEKLEKAKMHFDGLSKHLESLCTALLDEES